MSSSLHIPGFEVLSLIGKGGMGAVYKARQTRLDRVVALKVIDPEVANDESFGRRFLKEAHSAGKLAHENVVRAYDAGRVGGFYYICMEWIDGESLHSLLAREGRLEERRALTIALQVARALDHAHHHQLVHRDVKPGNILLARDGTAKLCDFGLARDTKSAHITERGVLIGSPYYMAPEQGAQDLDIRADLYSLGATLYHLLVGAPPFEGPNAMTVVMKHVTEAPVPPGRRRPGIAPATDAIVLHALAKDPEDRYQTPAEMMKDLSDAVARFDAPTEGMPVPPSAPISGGAPREEPPPSAVPRAALFSLLAALVLLVAVLASFHRSQPPAVSTLPSSPAPPITPDPPPPPAPSPPPAPDRAKLALLDAEERSKGWRDHLDLVPETLHRLEVIVSDPSLKENVWRDAAEARLTAFRDEVEQEASRRLAAITDKAKGLVEQERHYEAWLLYDAFPPQLAGTKASAEAAQVAQACRRREAQAVDAAWKTAETELLAGHDDTALLALARVKEVSGPEQKERIVGLEKEVNDAPYRRAEAHEAYDKLHADFLEAESHRKPVQAREALEAALADEKNKWYRTDIEEDLADAKLVEQVLADAERGARKLVEKKTTVRLAGFDKVVRFEAEGDAVVIVTWGGARYRYAGMILLPSDLARLADEVLPSKEAETHLKYGLLFWLVGGARDPGTETFRRAEAELKQASSDPRAARALEQLRPASK